MKSLFRDVRFIIFLIGVFMLFAWINKGSSASFSPSVSVRDAPITGLISSPSDTVVSNPGETVGVVTGSASIGRTKESDELLGETEEGTDPFTFISNSRIGYLLRQHLINATSFGSEAEIMYQESLEDMRNNASEVVAELISAYNNLPEEKYFIRWIIIDTLNELKSGDALEALDQIARSNIPEERFSPNMGISSVENEIIIRLAATRGISALAKEGITEAEERLIDLFKTTGYRPIKIQAIQGYLNAEYDGATCQCSYEEYLTSPSYLNRTNFLTQVIPQEEQHYLEIKPATSKDFLNIERQLISIMDQFSESSTNTRLPNQNITNQPETLQPIQR